MMADHGSVTSDDFEREIQDYINRFPIQQVQKEVEPVDTKPKPTKSRQARSETSETRTNEVIFYIYNSDHVRNPDAENQKIIKLPIDSSGKVCLKHNPFFRKSVKEESLFLINEETSEVIHVTNIDIAISCREGSRYGILCKSMNKINKESEYPFIISEDSLNNKKIESLSDISMTRATVFWIAFPRIFFALSEIKNDFELENDIKKYKYLTCPGSLKATLFQMAVSINNFVKLQVDHTHDLMDEEPKADHYSKSVDSLRKINAEVNEFINLIMEYMRMNMRNKNTVTLFYKMKDLSLLDKDIHCEEEKCKQEKYTDELLKDEIPKIFGKNNQLEICLKDIVSQRRIFNYIFDFVDEAIENDEFNLSNIFNILTLLKELICDEIKHFLHANNICSSKGNSKNVDYHKEQCIEWYKNVYELWKSMGTVSSLIVNYSENSSDWGELRNEILNTQRIIEIQFYAIMNHESCRRVRVDSERAIDDSSEEWAKVTRNYQS